MEITAVVADHTGAELAVETLELADPGPGEVLVRLVATGVCHTDTITRHGDLPLPLPGVLGHEGAGVVEKLGEGVDQLAVGDHVVMGWPFCGTCRNCRRGETKYCDLLGPAVGAGVRFMGPNAGTSAYSRPDGTPVSGHFFGQSSFATYSIALASSLVKVDDDLPLEILGPLACGLSTGAGAIVNTAKPQAGDTIVVFGVGAVGLAAIMAARNSPTAAIGLYRQGRFPFDELVRMYELADVEQAIADSVSGEVIKPVLRISEV